MTNFKENRIREGRTHYMAKNITIYGLIHVVPFLAFFTGTNRIDWIICAVLYFVRMFFITGGYHRYFAHRAFKTSRAFQFFLAFMAQTSVQKGVLWWAANHRVHHRYSDENEDPHSMKLFGFLHSHMGWLFIDKYKPTRLKLIGDYAKFKELVWLNNNHLVPPFFMALTVFLIGGFTSYDGVAMSTFWTGAASCLFIGFFLSTIILYQGTYSINSLMHLIGRKRYKTTDNSRNSFVLALITLGEGWHNNHHHYMASLRQGWFWWEIDITFYILKIFSWMGLIWDIVPVPDKIKFSHKDK